MTGARGACVLALCASLAACGGAVATRGNAGARGGAASARAPGAARGDAGALEALRAGVQGGDPAALRAANVALRPAGGAREMTGEAAADERVERATVVAREAATAALLVETSCGNALLESLRFDGTRWVPGDRVALVEGLEPGRCGQTNVRAEAIALSTDARREIAVVVVSQDVTGDSIRGPFLSVFQLQPEGRLGTMLRDAPFGAMDDATGATTTGVFNVVEDIPAPRDLFVEIRPGRLGPGGAPASEIVRRRYAVRGARLEMVQQSTEAAE